MKPHPKRFAPIKLARGGGGGDEKKLPKSRKIPEKPAYIGVEGLE